jgi:hypothetical protein
MKKFSTILFAIFTLFSSSAIGQKKIIATHFDVIERLSDVRSHCNQLIKEIKKWTAKDKIAEAQKIYFSIKAKGDGVSSRYKSIIDNPKLAIKSKENIKLQLNELTEEHNKLVKFYDDNYKAFVTGSSFSASAFPLDLIKEIATTLISEIKKAIQEKRDRMKKEIDDNLLELWDDIK